MLTELNSILSNKNVFVLYQPIVSLSNASIIGYEVLSRGPADSLLHSPNELFKTAKKYNKTFELELLCKTKTSEELDNIKKDLLLFINVDPYVFQNDEFKRYILKDFFKANNFCPSNIVFEINEKNTIEDYSTFKKHLNDYLKNGYKIAIDDMGIGNSGLRMLAETKPNYIKIDMYFIRDVDKDSFKQKIIEALVKLAESSNIKIIAEGIETKEELETLISLGVHLGQGYIFNKPSKDFLPIAEHIHNFINQFNKTQDIDMVKIYSHCIGEIANPERTFPLNAYCKDIKEYCDENNITGVVIVKDNVPQGLAMKYSLDSILATQFGVAVFSKRPINLVMDKTPLIVDYSTSVYDASIIAMERRTDNIYDYIIVTKNDKYFGIVTIQSLLNFTTKLEYNYARQLSPLTELPGNALIEKVLSKCITSKSTFCILYFDLDNFKVYNDCYGFENGDRIIKYTAKLIETECSKLLSDKVFIGHIGGDDFICIFEDFLDKCNNLCSNIIERFNKEILDFFNKEDINNGFIESHDRNGTLARFPLTSVSIGGLNGRLNKFTAPEDIAMFISSVKKEAKKIQGSCYIIKSI